MKTDLSRFNNDWFDPGAGILKRTLWFFLNAWVLQSKWLPFYGCKRGLLRLFGAKIGKGVVIKPGVSIKFPWKLEVGDHTWIGENAWIDNLARVRIGPNCCVSQGALLLTGNHDYKKSSFDLRVGEIVLEEGAWVGAKSVVTQNVILGTHSVLAVGSVASKSLEPFTIYAGNPAVAVRKRVILQ